MKIGHFPTWLQFRAMWCHYIYTTLSIKTKVLQIVDNIIIIFTYFIVFNEFKSKKCGYSKLSQGDWPLSHSIPILSYVVPLWLYHPIHWDQSSINIWQYYYFNVFYCCLMNLSQKSIEIASCSRGDWPLSHPISV